MTHSPHVVVLAGPNGAGKSTAALALLNGALGVDEFVNADTIAAGLSGFRPEGAAIEAGRIMLRHMHHLATRGANFAFETTLSGRTAAQFMAELHARGYVSHLLYLWLPSVEFAIERVRTRGVLGGHTVPEETIRRRYTASLRNFDQLYRPLATSWRIYDSSDLSGPDLVASGAGSDVHTVHRSAQWLHILTRLHDRP